MTETDAGPFTPEREDRPRYINQRPMEIDADAEVYNMNRKVRKAVIFNHFKFSHDNLEPRKGTEHDVKRLLTVLKFLNFSVTVHQDLTRGDLYQQLINLQKEDHSDCECLAIIVLTHGKVNKLAAEDKYYGPDELWNHFSSVACPTMAGKPKMIIINACRGEAFDFGTEFLCDLTTDGPQDSEDNTEVILYHLPNNADILVAFSTFDGYFSHREIEGTWFIQALCDVLMDEKYNKMEVKQLLTRVTRKVALRKSIASTKQVPVVVSTLVRDLYLL